MHAFLDTSKPLATHYGAIKGLTGLGRHTIQLLLLPNLPPCVCPRCAVAHTPPPPPRRYWKLLMPELSAQDATRQADARKVGDALMVHTAL